MRIHYTIIVVGLLLFSGCQSTTPAKIDNPVVGPPPPRLPADQIRERQLAYAGRSDDTRTAQAGDPDRVGVDDADSEKVRAGRKLSPSGIQRVSLEESPDKDLPRFEDSMVVAFVNDQPVFAGEVLAPLHMALAKAEEQMRIQEGKKFKPEMVYRLRGMFIRQALPRIIETKMLALAAKSEFKKNQLEGLNKAIDKDWAEHLQKMMEGNKCKSIGELETLMAEKDYDLAEHEAAYREQQFAQNYVGFKAHSKFEPTRREMMTYYEEHLKDYEFPARVHWQQLVISDEAHKGKEGAKQHLDKAVKELLEEAEFTAVVKKYGDGPKAANGGIWDWTIKGSLQNKEIENELFTLPVGEMSGVIRTPTGFQIVQVLDRQDAGRKTFESQQKDIEDTLKNEARTIRAKEAIHEIREAAVVKTVFDAEEPEEKAAKTAEKIKRVSAFDEQPQAPAKKGGAAKSTAAKSTVSQAGATDEPPKESFWKSIFRQKPAVADDNGEMNNISD